MINPFIIRIRLQNATEKDYVELVKIITSKGYSVKILSKEPKYYILPLGNFFIESANEKYEILENVKTIVESCWSAKYQILVTQTIQKGNAWCGLVEL